MPLGIGIVGLPNVGKSTAFNALTKAQNAQVANYPFCTIEPNKAVVPVPDDRLERIAEIVKPQRLIHATVEFFDIAGLVAGASKGEGLGNKFLANIRECSAIVHVVRCFDDDNVIHVHGKTDPTSDIEVINTELILADIQTLERKIERLAKQAKGDKEALPLLHMAEELVVFLGTGSPASTFPRRSEAPFLALNQELSLLTSKTVIFAANVDEAALAEGNAYVEAVRAVAAKQHSEVVVLCAKMEEEMVGMTDEERHEFLASVGAEESGLEQVIHKGYRALGLISYFTAGEKEARAWTIPKGATAPQAAGVIHSDFERGFIRAEVISYDAFLRHKGEAQARAAGELRIEGKEYVVVEGDVVHFRFNV